MKRKMPKNQRPYATPSGKKTRLTEVCDVEVGLMTGLGAPHVYSHRVGSIIKFFANTGDLAKWRASQTTSGAEPK